MTMNAGELLANSLSSGKVTYCGRPVLPPHNSLSRFFRLPNTNSHPSPLSPSDQATRENATQKLEQASRENYVRRTFYSPFRRLTPPSPPLLPLPLIPASLRT